MDFLNHREKIMVFCQVFLLSPLQCTLSEFEEIEISRQSCRCEFQGGKLRRLLSGFRPGILPQV
jgi:hypothetical protein